MRALGITNVLKLNPEGEGSDVEARRMGMNVYAAPIPLPQQFGFEKLDMARIEETLKQIPTNGTFIHCEHGQDRTGLVVAMWRVEKDGWTKADAEKEMLAHGFHKELRGLWVAWKSFKPVAPGGS